MDLSDVEAWIRMHADPVGPIETAFERPWATVLRVPLAGAHGVPDRRLAALPALYGELLDLNLPLQRGEIRQLAQFASRFAELCDDLAAYGVPETIQHDDLHHANLYVRDGSMRVLDWGDASIAHPSASLVVTFRFLEERSGLAPGDPWFSRLRDAYLAPWNGDLRDAFALALRVGTFARPIAYIRQGAAIAPETRSRFDEDFSIVLRRAVAQTLD